LYFHFVIGLNRKPGPLAGLGARGCADRPPLDFSAGAMKARLQRTALKKRAGVVSLEKIILRSSFGGAEFHLTAFRLRRAGKLMWTM